MTEASQHCLNSLEALRQAAWQEFDTRRAFEWKVSLALWTAMFAFAGALLSGKPTIDYGIRVIACHLAVALLILHIYFLCGVAKRHHADREKEHFFRNQILAVLHLELPADIRTQEKGHSSVTWTYSLTFQVGVTLVAVLVDLAAILAKGPTR